MPVVIAVAVPHPPLIVPGVGHGREREVQATVDAYREVARRIAALAKRVPGRKEVVQSYGAPKSTISAVR